VDKVDKADKEEKIGVLLGFLRLGEVRWGRAAMHRFVRCSLKPDAP